MNQIRYFIFLITISLVAQPEIQADLDNKLAFGSDQLIAIDNFNTTYHIIGEAFYKTNAEGSINYSNVQLGRISSASVFNPLKINIFYHDFNTAVILDNRLAEITKIDFNNKAPFRVVTQISTGNDNTIWLYNQNTQQLELFDYITQKTRITTLPIKGEVIDMNSNYNYCWVLTKEHIYTYNYFGSLTEKIPNPGFSKLEEDNDNIYLQRENSLFFKHQNVTEIQPIKLPELLINQFLVTDETLYIYDGEILHRFQLKMN